MQSSLSLCVCVRGGLGAVPRGWIERAFKAREVLELALEVYGEGEGEGGEAV